MNQQEQIINTALETYPLADLPSGFVRKTMVQIKPRPRFQLKFIDYALPVFFATFGALVLFVLLWMVNILNPLPGIIINVNKDWLSLLTSQLPLGLLAIAVVGGLLCFAIGLTAIGLLLEKPTYLHSKIL